MSTLRERLRQHLRRDAAAGRAHAGQGQQAADVRVAWSQTAHAMPGRIPALKARLPRPTPRRPPTQRCQPMPIDRTTRCLPGRLNAPNLGLSPLVGKTSMRPEPIRWTRSGPFRRDAMQCPGDDCQGAVDQGEHVANSQRHVGQGPLDDHCGVCSVAPSLKEHIGIVFGLI